MENENKTNSYEQSRWRSPVVWSSILAVIMTTFSVFGIWDKIGITAAGFNEIAGAVGALLAAFGIINNPTSKNRF